MLIPLALPPIYVGSGKTRNDGNGNGNGNGNGDLIFSRTFPSRALLGVTEHPKSTPRTGWPSCDFRVDRAPSHSCIINRPPLQHGLNPSVTLPDWMRPNNAVCTPKPIHRLYTQTFPHQKNKRHFWGSNLQHLRLAGLPVKICYPTTPIHHPYYNSMYA